ncbi:hypothetical protein [Herbiconiux daphne]|uniref:Lipoprotein n=1 Tax=Herbiconiux daphne TaxID=2970914 RepID=A0ABT2GWK3_9MICO|nr:hypothetical protein [Herbiconiux daphne]MCS5732335.1 hypothetical protein [Herbiconiux daphne]
MKTKMIVSATGAAVLGLLLSGCASNAQAQAAYDACSGDDDYGIMKVDGSSVLVELKGDNARIASSLGDDLNDALSGNGKPKTSDSPSSLQIALTMLGDVDCLTEQTNYPGASDDLSDGEEWDGWKYSYEKGAGSEETHRFTAR